MIVNDKVDLNAAPERALLSAYDAMRRRMAAMAEAWPLEGCAFAIDRERLDAVLELADGRRARAPAQILGGYTARGAHGPGAVRFQWAWADPSVPRPLAAAAEAVRGYGEARGVAELTSPGAHVAAERLGRYAGLACALGHGVAMLTGAVEGQADVMSLLIIGPPTPA